MTRSIGLVQRVSRSLKCKNSKDVACAGDLGVLTTLATPLEFLHLQLLVPLFTQILDLFFLLVRPHHTSRLRPGGCGRANSILGPLKLTFTENTTIVAVQ